MYRSRWIEERVLRTLKNFPVVALSGPRRAGKSTLLRHLLLPKGFRHVSLDSPALLDTAKRDPELFLLDHPPPVIIDEAQRCPELFSAIKARIDQNPRKGQYVLSGSASFLLMKSLSESLAGRAGYLRLLPMSCAEANRRPLGLFAKTLLEGRNLKTAKCPAYSADWPKHLLWGGYPEVILTRSHQQRLEFLESYLATNLEKDIRDMVQVGDMAAFRQVYRMLAARTGEPTEHAEIASVVGISRDTVRRWHSVLETAYQFVRVPPYSRNIGKRLVKSPRVYPLDVGVANYINRQHDLPSLQHGPLYGKMLEAFILGELMKAAVAFVPTPNFYYWRTSSGAEVDFVIETRNGLVPLEVKAAVRVTPRDVRGLETFLDTHKNNCSQGYVICRTEQSYRITRNIRALPIHWVVS